MSEIERLLAKSKKVTLDGIEVEVHSFSTEEFIELSKIGESNIDVRTQATKDLLMKALRKSFPTATEDQLKKFDMRYVGKFLLAVYEASGLEVDRKKLDEMMASLS